MKRSPFSFLISALLLLTNLSVLATEVPYTMEFAGMKLRISDQGRKRIQADMEILKQNDKYFQAKLERVDMYFPLIEKILEEEGLPDDFKYLAVQESSLVSDAVSTSNAVGYWQFKKESALEVGMVVNGEVDERKHIVTATRGAARYLKRNNYFLKNWVFTLLSYNLGLGGAKSIINQRDIGAEKMDIDIRTHWYIIKFLAHMLTFQEVIGKQAQPNLTLLQYTDCKGKTLHEISRHMEVSLEDLELYNKWLNKKRVPEDRDYIVIIPAPTSRVEVLMAKLNTPSQAIPEVSEAETALAYEGKLNTAFPVLKRKNIRNKSGKQVVFYTINGKPGIQAQPGDNIAKLSDKSGISREKFIKYNDLKANEGLIPGEVYYLKKKRNKAKVHEHIVTEGETLWQISQMYGVTMQALMRKNRMRRPEKLQHGRVVWLRNIRPANVPVEIKNIPKPATAIAFKTKDEVVKEPKVTSKTQVKPKEDKPVVVEKEKPTLTEKPPITEKQKTQETKNSAIAEKPAVINKPVEAEKKDEPVVTVLPKSEPKIEDVKSPASPKQEPIDSVQQTTVKDSNEVQIKEQPVPAIEEEEGESEQPASTHTTKTHIVTKGQSLYAISKMYNVTVSQLRLWNHLNQADAIKVGQNLIIEEEGVKESEEISGEDQYIEYIVKAGDSLYKIAREHAVTVKDLAAWNNKTSYGVAIGEKIKIKASK